MDNNNWPCRDTRTREVGIAALQGKPGKKIKAVRDIELIRRDYVGSDGWETFLSYEDPEADLLIGLLRLRLPTEGKFMSVEEMKIRAGVGKSTVELLEKAGCLKGMTLSNQMSLFTF